MTTDSDDDWVDDCGSVVILLEFDEMALGNRILSASAAMADPRVFRSGPACSDEVLCWLLWCAA